MIGPAKDWMQGLSASERLLIAVALALVVLLGGSLLVVSPLRDSHARAEREYAEAARLLAEARDAAAIAASRGPVGAAVDVRAVATTSAVARGLSIARMTPVDREGLSVRFDRADPAVLYAWLAELEAGHGVAVRRASMRRLERADVVEADIVLRGASPS